jgi:hypothetical protein
VSPYGSAIRIGRLGSRPPVRVSAAWLVRLTHGRVLSWLAPAQPCFLVWVEGLPAGEADRLGAEPAPMTLASAVRMAAACWFDGAV